MKKYQDWIFAHYPTSKESYGNCRQAAHALAAAFPELEVTNGFVFDACWGERMHWWCKTQSGEILDPSKNQFPHVLEYQEIDDTHDARRFASCTCANCGEQYYLKSGANATVCGERCWREYAAYLNSRF